MIREFRDCGPLYIGEAVYYLSFGEFADNFIAGFQFVSGDNIKIARSSNQDFGINVR